MAMTEEQVREYLDGIRLGKYTKMILIWSWKHNNWVEQ